VALAREEVDVKLQNNSEDAEADAYLIQQGLLCGERAQEGL
jgi:hypothetical protein